MDQEVSTIFKRVLLITSIFIQLNCCGICEAAPTEVSDADNIIEQSLNVDTIEDNVFHFKQQSYDTFFPPKPINTQTGINTEFGKDLDINQVCQILLLLHLH